MQRAFPGLNSQESAESLDDLLSHDRSLWIGIGCNRGVSTALIAHAIDTTLQHHNFRMAAIAAITTLDRKANEAGLVKFCRSHRFPLYTLAAAVLDTVPVPHPSVRLLEQVGTVSVAEACAIQGSETWGGGCDRLCVPKTVVRLIDEPGAVTIAIAQACHPLCSS
jgi:cobalamin biosynthesis protein CbiG